MPSNSKVLLDTMVVAGLFAVTKNKDKYAQSNKTEWERVIASLFKKCGLTDCRLSIPNSVCYELMSMNQGWFNFISENSDDLFRFSRTHINNDVLAFAAKYSFESQTQNEDGKFDKVKGLDPITAAYSIMYDYYLITENLKDFPDSYFEVIALESAILDGQKGRYRKILALLKPRLVAK